MKSLFIKTANYILIIILFIWIFSGAANLLNSGFSFGKLILAIMLAVVAYSIYWMFKLERFYYKLVMWILFFNMILKIFLGLSLNVELVPFFIALYIYDNLKVMRQKNFAAEAS